MMVVKNKDGKLNIDSLKQIQQIKMPESKPGDKPVKIKIDNLSLNIERVIYKEYNPNGEIAVKPYHIGLKEDIKDIQDLNVVVSMIIFKALSKTSIAALTNIDISGLGSMATDTIKNTTQAATAVLGQTGETTKETIENTAEGLKNIFKKPFGDK
jgi:hypothetical protein